MKKQAGGDSSSQDQGEGEAVEGFMQPMLVLQHCHQACKPCRAILTEMPALVQGRIQQLLWQGQPQVVWTGEGQGLQQRSGQARRTRCPVLQVPFALPPAARALAQKPEGWRGGAIPHPQLQRPPLVGPGAVPVGGCTS
jgi:hypothetical protein